MPPFRPTGAKTETAPAPSDPVQESIDVEEESKSVSKDTETSNGDVLLSEDDEGIQLLDREAMLQIR